MDRDDFFLGILELERFTSLPLLDLSFLARAAHTAPGQAIVNSRPWPDREPGGLCRTPHREVIG